MFDVLKSKYESNIKELASAFNNYLENSDSSPEADFYSGSTSIDMYSGSPSIDNVDYKNRIEEFSGSKPILFN